MPDLLVTIGADASQYNKAMADAGTTAATTSGQITASVNEADKSLVGFGNTALSASMKFQQMRSGVSAARDGVMALSVGGQSADRYLMAFGHHLTSLTNETGSFGGALKSLAGSLWGAGGIILALSVAAELWDKYSKGQKEAKMTADDYVKSLDSVNQAQLKGEQNGQAEITRLQILYQATQNHTLSLQDRNKAYDELEKKYPTYFTNAEREKTLLGENATLYNTLAGAIMAAAYAKAYENQIGENAGKIDVLQSQRYGLAYSLQQAKKALAQVQALTVDTTASANNDSLGTTQAAKDALIANARQKVLDIEAQIAAFKQQENQLTKDNIELSKRALDEEKAAGFKTGGEHGGNAPKAALDAYQQAEKAVNDAQEAVNVAMAEGKLKADDFGSTLNRNLQSAKKILEDIKSGVTSLDTGLGQGVKGAGIEGGNAGAFKPDNNAGDDLASSLDKQNAAFNQNSGVISENLKYLREWQDADQASARQTKQQSQSLKELTRQIGSGLQNAFEQALSGTESFTQAMGQFLTGLIEKLIAAAAAALILSLIIGSFTGLGGSGTFGDISKFKDIFGGLSGLGNVKLASGGIVTGPTRALIGEGNEPETVMPLSKLQKFVNTSSINGGISNGQIIGVLSGPNLLLKWQTRAQKQRGRIA